MKYAIYYNKYHLNPQGISLERYCGFLKIHHLSKGLIKSSRNLTFSILLPKALANTRNPSTTVAVALGLFFFYLNTFHATILVFLMNHSGLCIGY